jgi:hypothetical protein
MIKSALFLLLAGVSIGWCVGLSASPVIGLVVPAVLALLASLASITAGKGDTSEPGAAAAVHKVKPAPVAMLVVGIALGATLGLRARSHSWLSPTIDDVIDQWAKRGVDRKVVLQRVFDSEYPPRTSSSPAVDVRQSVLFSADSEACARLQVYDGEQLRLALQSSTLPELGFIAKRTSDTETLKAVVRLICVK